jgi:hypothetical protein
MRVRRVGEAAALVRREGLVLVLDQCRLAIGPA